MPSFRGYEYGADSRRYLAEEIATRFNVRINGEEVLSKPFTRPKRVEFAPPLGAVTARLFLFSDQVHYPATLGASTVSRLALLPQSISNLMAMAGPIAGRRLAHPGGATSQRLEWLMEWLERKYRALDWWGVHIEVRGARGVHRASMQGHGQANATALSASAFVRALVEGEVDRPGIWTADQVVPLRAFLERMTAHGLVPRVNVREHSNPGSGPH